MKTPEEWVDTLGETCSHDIAQGRHEKDCVSRGECSACLADTIRQAVKEAVEAEREACAVLVERSAYRSNGVSARENVVARIRTRQAKEK